MKEAVREELDAREDEGRKLVRQQIQEMDDVCEKFARVVARQTARMNREAKAALERTDNGAVQEGPQLAGKAGLRARLASQVFNRNRPSGTEG